MVVFKWPLKNGTGTWVLQEILTIPGKECSGNGDKPTSIGQMVLYRSRTSSRHTGVQFESIVKTALYWGNWGYLQLSLPHDLVQLVKVFRWTVPDKNNHRTHTILNLSLVYFCSFFFYFTISSKLHSNAFQTFCGFPKLIFPVYSVWLNIHSVKIYKLIY